MTRIFVVFLAAAVGGGLLYVPPVFSADDPEAGEIVEEVREAVEDFETLSCRFVREQYWQAVERTNRIEGSLYLKKPHFLRVEYPGHTLVIDGENVWSYLPKNNQVQISTYLENENGFMSPHTLFVRYAERRATEYLGMETIGTRECDVLKLPPNSPGDPEVTVWIDRELHFPMKTREVLPTGDATVHLLLQISLNRDLDDSLFEFEPPEGVEIVDMRE